LEPTDCPTPYPSPQPTQQTTSKPSQTPTMEPTLNPSAEPTTFPSPAPTDAMDLFCDDDVLERKGHFDIDEETLTFTVTLTHRGRLVFDARHCELGQIALSAHNALHPEILYSTTAHSSADGEVARLLQLENVPAGDYVFVISAEQSGTYNVQLRADCESVSPSVYPTPEPTSRPSASPTVEPTMDPSIGTSNSPTLEPTLEPISLWASSHRLSCDDDDGGNALQGQYRIDEKPFYGELGLSFAVQMPFYGNLIFDARQSELGAAVAVNGFSVADMTRALTSYDKVDDDVVMLRGVNAGEYVFVVSAEQSGSFDVRIHCDPTQRWPTAQPISFESTTKALSAPTSTTTMGPRPTNAPSTVQGSNSAPSSHFASAEESASSKPSTVPTPEPTPRPTKFPSPEPTPRPTAPTESPIVSPTETPTVEPTMEPTTQPTMEPTREPVTENPTQIPSMWPTPAPHPTTPSPTRSPLRHLRSYFVYDGESRSSSSSSDDWW